MDLANTVPDPQVQICLVQNVNQRPLRVSPCSGCHRIVGPEHGHLPTNIPELFSPFYTLSYNNVGRFYRQLTFNSQYFCFRETGCRLTPEERPGSPGAPGGPGGPGTAVNHTEGSRVSVRCYLDVTLDVWECV